MRAEQIRIDRCDVVEAPIRPVIEFLSSKAQEKVRREQRVRIEYISPTPALETRITVLLSGVDLLDMLKVVSLGFGLEISATDDALYLHWPGKSPVLERSIRSVELGWSNRTIAVTTGFIQATAERDGFLNARRLLELSFRRDRANQPAFDLLQKEIDRCEKRRVAFNRSLQAVLSRAPQTPK